MQFRKLYYYLLLLWTCLLYYTQKIPRANAEILPSQLPRSFKYPQNFISNESDDDYLSQKENVLEKSYHGLIRENETLVEITPLIKVDEEKICNFRILKKPYHEIPFQIELVNNLGILRARRTLNCEKRKSYHFEIMAIFCDGTHSTISNVHITVIDINEYAPTFLQPSYVTEVDEGRLYKEIIRVEATDKDCTPLFGDVCKYGIMNNDQPFTVDNEGSIKNTEPLSYKASHNHILSVVAYDCAMKESAPIMVSIKVRRVCEARFLGIPERIDYTAASNESLSLFPNARLELCDMYCDSQHLNIHTYITLKTKHISFGCDRDISNCTTAIVLIDLLPRDVEWTKDLNFDEGLEPIFHFDGISGVIIPNSVVAHHDFSTRPFTIVTKFRHFRQSDVSNKHIKEHIVCSADDHKMNRHHMALFIRNCRLILLLRKNFNEGELNIFSPAEWRWKLPQVCDNEWHHYVLNVNQLTKVDLFIDGVLFENTMEGHHNNPEVIDDWPLHAAHGVNTTLAVGACYQSSENRLKHGFNGDISEIKVSLSGVLTADDVKCGTNCAEYLIAPPENLLEIDSQVQVNVQQNEIYIEGQGQRNIEQLLQKIQYINSKKRPTIGRRNIELRTTMMCVNQSTIRLPTVETYVMVNEQNGLSIPSKNLYKGKEQTQRLENVPVIRNASNRNNVAKLHGNFSVDKVATLNFANSKIVITGNSNNLISYTEIKRGVHILGDINITVFASDRNMDNFINGDNFQNIQRLDSCSVIVFPALNPDHEEIQIDGDESLSSTLDIKTNINKDGVEMIGNDAIPNYLDLLKALIYSNKKPAYYLNRVFKLSCNQLNSQFKSVDFTLTLTVLHPKQLLKTTSLPAVLSTRNAFNTEGIVNTEFDSNVVFNAVESAGLYSSTSDNKIYSHVMMHSHDVQEPKSNVRSIIHNVENSHPTMLIILICAFLVVLLCGVSIVRLKNNHKYTNRHHPCPKIAEDNLIWDDSALTITINPIQTDVVSEESSDSENSESEDDEVIKGRFSNVNQLEWDNSNMFTTGAN